MDLLLEATALAEQHHFWFRGFRRFAAPLLKQAASGRRGLRILDCGCGTGYNIRSLLEPCGAAWGVDLAPTGLEHARRAGVARLARASVTALPFAPASFDIATSFDVLYALPDEAERAAVAEMWRVLKPGGAAVVNVAAMPVLRGHHSVLAAEIRRYTPAALRALLERTGFRLERMRYTHAAVFPLLLAVRSVQRAAGPVRPDEALADLIVPAAPINAALSGLLAVEAAVSRAVPMPFGSSLLCLARKPA
ncbi:MAG TPA: class I SAM-dependent methyltransferase [Vicinamibacterales bacterium]|nr:class I SAM-dependent methyltransferase [Vicinamibacterales bacterium]HOQ59442.1 class I SAM-dependent methyltransferase [Vicinamibacterales bacterium]HPK71443.1 class I SAM-dependent methyltransferase [Vicinamibacterales bacterium]